MAFFLCLHLDPDVSRDCPMVYWYALLLASCFIKVVMLTNMLSTGRVSPSVERSMFGGTFGEFWIVANSPEIVSKSDRLRCILPTCTQGTSVLSAR